MHWEVAFGVLGSAVLLTLWLWLIPQTFGKGFARQGRQQQIEAGLISLALLNKGSDFEDAWDGVRRNRRESPLMPRGHLRRHLKNVR